MGKRSNGPGEAALADLVNYLSKTDDNDHYKLNCNIYKKVEFEEPMDNKREVTRRVGNKSRFIETLKDVFPNTGANKGSKEKGTGYTSHIHNSGNDNLVSFDNRKTNHVTSRDYNSGYETISLNNEQKNNVLSCQHTSCVQYKGCICDNFDTGDYIQTRDIGARSKDGQPSELSNRKADTVLVAALKGEEMDDTDTTHSLDFTLALDKTQNSTSKAFMRGRFKTEYEAIDKSDKVIGSLQPIGSKMEQADKTPTTCLKKLVEKEKSHVDIPTNRPLWARILESAPNYIRKKVHADCVRPLLVKTDVCKPSVSASKVNGKCNNKNNLSASESNGSMSPGHHGSGSSEGLVKAKSRKGLRMSFQNESNPDFRHSKSDSKDAYKTGSTHRHSQQVFFENSVESNEDFRQSNPSSEESSSSSMGFQKKSNEDFRKSNPSSKKDSSISFQKESNEDFRKSNPSSKKGSSISFQKELNGDFRKLNPSSKKGLSMGFQKKSNGDLKNSKSDSKESDTTGSTHRHSKQGSSVTFQNESDWDVIASKSDAKGAYKKRSSAGKSNVGFPNLKINSENLLKDSSFEGFRKASGDDSKVSYKQQSNMGFRNSKIESVDETKPVPEWVTAWTNNRYEVQTDPTQNSEKEYKEQSNIDVRSPKVESEDEIRPVPVFAESRDETGNLPNQYAKTNHHHHHSKSSQLKHRRPLKPITMVESFCNAVVAILFYYVLFLFCRFYNSVLPKPIYEKENIAFPFWR